VNHVAASAAQICRRGLRPRISRLKPGLTEAGYNSSTVRYLAGHFSLGRAAIDSQGTENYTSPRLRRRRGLAVPAHVALLKLWLTGDAVMKVLVFLAALAIVGLVVTGAIHLQKTNDNTLDIQVDKARVEQDAERVVDEGKALFHKAEADLQSNSQSPSRN
jgi:hypothetical protein